jgi:hypothetical protein
MSSKELEPLHWLQRLTIRAFRKMAARVRAILDYLSENIHFAFVHSP